MDAAPHALPDISFSHIPLGYALPYTRGKHTFNIGGNFHGCAEPDVWFCCFYLVRLCDSEQADSLLKKQKEMYSVSAFCRSVVVLLG